MEKPRILLWCTGGIGVILEYNSGVLYCNQTGGHSSRHPELEGIYVPLRDRSLGFAICRQESRLIDYFKGSKWHSWCNDGIDNEDADYVDSVLTISHYSKRLKVDRSKLKDSHDAWIHVVIDTEIPSSSQETDLFIELQSKRGVLTWDDSD